MPAVSSGRLMIGIPGLLVCPDTPRNHQCNNLSWPASFFGNSSKNWIANTVKYDSSNNAGENMAILACKLKFNVGSTIAEESLLHGGVHRLAKKKLLSAELGNRLSMQPYPKRQRDSTTLFEIRALHYHPKLSDCCPPSKLISST